MLSKNYDLVVKNSGVDAFNWLEEGNDPDLIISDLNMPYFDGNSFIRNLKISGYYRDTPIILLSGADDLDKKVIEMGIKVESFIQKPFNPDELKSIINNLIPAEV